MTVSSGTVATGIMSQNLLCPNRNERHIVFPKMLFQNCRDFCATNTMYNKDPDKAGTARYDRMDKHHNSELSTRRLLSSIIESENTNVYSLEVSMYGYKPSAKSEKILPYTEENCEARWEEKRLLYFHFC